MRSRDYETIKNKFRPGHADYTYLKNMESGITEAVEDNLLARLLLELRRVLLQKLF